MLAIAITQPGPPEVLQPIERPIPEPAPGEIVIRVQAAGVAYADLLQRQGKYAPTPGASDIPGLDVAGIVHSVSPEATKSFVPGDAVCAILTGGGYSEYCAVPAVQVLPIPDGWSAVEAATLPENMFTVYDNLVTRGGLRSGETILIHGGASGVGSMAIMLARALGAVPVATAGSAKKCEACIEFGALLALQYKTADFVAELKEFTSGRGVDIILDMVGGPYLDRNLNTLALDGRLLIINVQGGSSGQLDIAKLMHRRASIIGSTLRARSAAQKGEIAEKLRAQVWPLLPAKNPIRPIVDSTFPLAQAALAHMRMESGEHIGKIILTV